MGDAHVPVLAIMRPAPLGKSGDPSLTRPESHATEPRGTTHCTGCPVTSAMASKSAS